MFNSILLQKCIVDAKVRKRNLNIAFLDMRKAIDSVSHAAIWTACKRVGIPGHLINYCKAFYARRSTEIVLGKDKLSDRITPRRGIAQGDPLSIHLFNAVIDMCTESIRDDTGYQLDRKKVSYLAFVDDLVLLADS